MAEYKPSGLPTKVCGVCCQPLGVFRDLTDPLDTGRYVHHTEEIGVRTHVVLPVDASEVEAVASHCDFCYSDGPNPWTVVCQPFTMEVSIPITNPDGSPGQTKYLQNSSALWAACDQCAALIKRRRWSQLTARGVASVESRHSVHSPVARTEVRRGIKELYSRVEAYFITVRPFDGSDYAADTRST